MTPIEFLAQEIDTLEQWLHGYNMSNRPTDPAERMRGIIARETCITRLDVAREHLRNLIKRELQEGLNHTGGMRMRD